MSNEIETARVQQYKANVGMLLQQRGSKLRGYLMEDSYVGKAAKVVEQIGQVTARRRTTRHGDTPLIETPHDARWVYPKDYEWADLIDQQDKLRNIVDFESPYAMNGAMAIGRALDQEIIRAFFADAKTGEDGDVTTAFATASQQVAHGGTGLSVAKLRQAKKILMANNVDLDVEPLTIAITAQQHDDMLQETQAISLDYTNRPSLVDGRITAFMGFNFVHTELLPVDGSGNRRLPCWAKSGMHCGIWDDLDVEIGPRADKGYSTQVYVKATFGATRIEEGKVVEILCAE